MKESISHMVMEYVKIDPMSSVVLIVLSIAS